MLGLPKKVLFISHMDEPVSLVEFSLAQDNVVLACGAPWRRSGAIPMGGSFSAQSTDLHCVWICKQMVSHVRQLSDVSRTDSGILQWLFPGGDTVALRQLRDNLMVASKGPSPHIVMYPVCMTMKSIWNLWVLCPCRDKNPDLVCHGDCITSS